MTTKIKKGQQFDLGADHVFVGTWNGGPGESHTFRMQSSDIGLRVVVHIWHHDLPVATVRKIKGTGWRPRSEAQRLREFYSEAVPTPTVERLMEAVARARAAKADDTTKRCPECNAPVTKRGDAYVCVPCDAELDESGEIIGYGLGRGNG